jgi:hypothetical protein
MPMLYRPRRARQQWLEGAPPYVLDVLGPSNARGDFMEYDILIWDGVLGEYKDTQIDALDISANGASCWWGLDAYDMAQYRYRNGKRRMKWADLPETIKKTVINRMQEAQDND